MPAPHTRAGNGAPLTAEQHDENVALFAMKAASIDAKGNPATPRPAAMPAEATLLWFNSPTEPVHMGRFDIWVDAG